MASTSTLKRPSSGKGLFRFLIELRSSGKLLVFLKKLPTENKRQLFIVAWFALLVTRQISVALLNRLRKNKKLEEDKVAVRGSKFTKTKGGPLNLSLGASLEFWMPTLGRASEAYGMYTVGHEFFSKGEKPIVRVAGMLTAVFGLIPLIENILPKDWSNPTKQQQEESSAYDRRYRYPLYLWTLLEMLTTIKMMQIAVDPKTPLKPIDKGAIVFLLGFFNGAFGINFSHELIHKHSKFEKVLGYFLLLNVNYLHWGEEHVTGHHRNVATPKDPASSRLNESLYSFLPRTIIGSWKSALEIETNRLKKLGKQTFSVHNRIIWSAILPGVWALTIGKLFTNNVKQAVCFFYAQSMVSIILLEIVNYLEHYGLQRKKLENGSYEPVNPTHSWNAPHRISNAALVKLQRHSDHHTYSTRPYHLLRNFEESPQLPAGYPGMVALAFCPPAWYWIMNPLVEANELNSEIMNKLKQEDENQPYVKQPELLKAERDAWLKISAYQLGFAVTAAATTVQIFKLVHPRVI